MESSTPQPRPHADSTSWVARGTPAYQHATLALFLLGFASFSLIYCVQPLLPEFTTSFAISPANSALALSLTTGFLAFSIVLSGAFSQGLARKHLMFGSMLIAALLNIACAFISNWPLLLTIRAIEGFVLGGVPAIAMAWIAEEIHPADLSKSMGVYIAGTAFGGMMGRVGMGLVVEHFSWHVAMAALGGLCVLAALGFVYLLPASKHFRPQRGSPLHFHLHAWRQHLANPRLLNLYAFAFLIMSVFVTTFNYVTFRLSQPPFDLSPTQISLIFLCYSLGIMSSSLAGNFSQRLGSKTAVLISLTLMLFGLITTLSNHLLWIVVGIALMTFGFFVAHALASSYVGLEAKSTKAHATSLYLLFYYLGSSVTGSAGGWFWQHGGWSAVIALCGTATLVAILLIQKRR